MNGKSNILISISPHIVPKGIIDNNPELIQHQAIIWTNADPIYWHIYAAPGGDKLGLFYL